MDVSLSVMKEPRGFIRVIQMIMAILAFSTTAGFSTTVSFDVLCHEAEKVELEYEIGYPFQLTSHHMELKECPANGGGGDDDDDSIRLPFDYSNTAEFFVGMGVASFLYTIIILVVYIFFHQTYANDPKAPVADLGLSAILTVFWLAGSSAWSQGVVDLKYYFEEDNLFGFLHICKEDNGTAKCEMESDGHFATLNVSLIFGFANFLLWLSSLWFVYKETIFHTPIESETSMQNQSKGDGRV